MSATFEDRRKGFEAKWAHDEEARFKVQGRRDYLIGLWAAGLKGLAGKPAEDFADSIIAADLAEPGEEDVFRKLRAELAEAVSDQTIRDKMHDLLEAAAEQFAKDMK